MIRLGWCLLLVGSPHLFFAQPEAVVLSVIVAFLLWSFLAVDRDHWRRVAALRAERLRPQNRPAHDDLTGTAPWLPRSGRPVPTQKQQRGDAS